MPNYGVRIITSTFLPRPQQFRNKVYNNFVIKSTTISELDDPLGRAKYREESIGLAVLELQVGRRNV